MRCRRPINDLVMNPAPAPAMHPSATIERVETVLLDLPTIRPHRLSVATMNGQTLMLVRIHCSDGVVGVGEGTTIGGLAYGGESPEGMRSEEHTSELQSLMRTSYAVFCLK